MNEKEIVENVCKILDSKKATDIRIIDLDGLSTLADYFVVCTGRSSTHVKSLMDNLSEEMEKKGVFMIRWEGNQDGKWCVADYGDVIVHIFYDETRQVYSFDDLWDKGNNIKVYES